MYLMSAVADNADQQAVEERLLETADEITDGSSFCELQSVL